MNKKIILKTLKESINNYLISEFDIINTKTGEKTRFDYFDIKKPDIDSKLLKILNNNTKFYLNSKNEKSFFKKFSKEFQDINLKDYFYLEKIKSDNYVILENGRIIGIEISNHAFQRFITRLIIFYLNFGHRKFDVSDNLKNDAKLIIKLIKEKKLEENKQIVTDLIIKYLKSGKPFKEKSLYRFRDKVNHKKRKQNYKDENVTLKITSHPFLFIVNTQENILKTVELYSSSFPQIDLLNKISKISSNNYQYLLNYLTKWTNNFRKK